MITLKRKYNDPRRTRIIEKVESKNSYNFASISQQKINLETDNKETDRQTKGRVRQSKNTKVESQILTLEAAPPPTEKVVVEFSHRGYVRRLPAKGFEKHKIDQKSIFNQKPKTLKFDGPSSIFQ